MLGPGQDGKTIRPEGLKCAALKEDQRATLLALIGAWVHILPDAPAAGRMAALKSQIDSRGGKNSTVLLVAQPGDHLFGVLVWREYRIEHLADDALVDD